MLKSEIVVMESRKLNREKYYEGKKTLIQCVKSVASPQSRVKCTAQMKIVIICK